MKRFYYAEASIHPLGTTRQDMGSKNPIRPASGIYAFEDIETRNRFVMDGALPYSRTVSRAQAISTHGEKAVEAARENPTTTWRGDES